jgi:hypothetical protein
LGSTSLIIVFKVLENASSKILQNFVHLFVKSHICTKYLVICTIKRTYIRFFSKSANRNFENYSFNNFLSPMLLLRNGIVFKGE